MKKAKIFSITVAMTAFGLNMLYAFVPTFGFLKPAVLHFALLVFLGWVTWGLLVLIDKDE